MGIDFAAKTMAEAARAIQDSIFSNQNANKNGLLQRIDPRVKLVTILLLLIVIGLARDIKILLAFYLLALILAALSRLPLGFFIKRVWVFIPIFTGIIALPAIFNIVTPGDPIFTVVTLSSPHRLGPFLIPRQITVTVQGITGAAILVLRVATSVSMAVLLVLTTEWVRLLRALSVLKAPEAIILILAMTYRYIQLFLRILEWMLLAKKSRQISATKIKEDYGWIASRLGVLVGKSYRLSNEVHLAMTARGWSGNPRPMNDFSIGLLDWVWTIFIIIIIGSWVILR